MDIPKPAVVDDNIDDAFNTYLAHNSLRHLIKPTTSVEIAISLSLKYAFVHGAGWMAALKDDSA